MLTALLIITILVSLASVAASVLGLTAIGNLVAAVNRLAESQHAEIEQATRKVIFETRSGNRWIAKEVEKVQTHLGIEKVVREPGIADQVAAALIDAGKF
jgi:hypothetical protein